MGITMDNATNNNTFMDFVSNHSYFNSELTSKRNRVRCLAHVINLAVQDLLAALKIPPAKENNNMEDEEDDDDEKEEENVEEVGEAEEEEEEMEVKLIIIRNVNI